MSELHASHVADRMCTVKVKKAIKYLSPIRRNTPIAVSGIVIIINHDYHTLSSSSSSIPSSPDR